MGYSCKIDADVEVVMKIKVEASDGYGTLVSRSKSLPTTAVESELGVLLELLQVKPR